jgi:hypothetical protein
VLLTKYNQRGQIKENEVGGAFGTYGEMTNAYRVSVGKRERNKLEDLSVDGY